ncbi:Plant transposon protein [Fragilaria crotonensis]|nr:Plant transposon protein [Fragilaria crotonensis]
MSFELLDKHGKAVCMKGAYVIVDNGYLQWSTTVPPFKDSSSRAEVRFSQWLESLRKDVECTFGILKNRWRILKTGIRLHNTEIADNIWLTCCALHNMLVLNVDGLNRGWQNGVPSYWEVNGNGNLEVSDLPRAIRRLNSPPEVLGDFLTMDRSSFRYRRPTSSDEDDDSNGLSANGTVPFVFVYRLCRKHRP